MLLWSRSSGAVTTGPVLRHGASVACCLASLATPIGAADLAVVVSHAWLPESTLRSAKQVFNATS